MDGDDPQHLLDERLVHLVGEDWQTAAQLQRLSGGDTIEVVKALDRLWRAGRIARESQYLGIGAKRLGGGRQFQRFRYRRMTSNL
jgi:hypothetical protein